MLQKEQQKLKQICCAKVLRYMENAHESLPKADKKIVITQTPGTAARHTAAFQHNRYSNEL